MSTPSTPQPATVSITVVEAPACHYCADALQALQEFAEEGYSLDVRTLDVRDPAGQELMRFHGAGMSPLVLVDGLYFSQGRLPRRKLAKHLQQSSPGTQVAGV